MERRRACAGLPGRAACLLAALALALAALVGFAPAAKADEDDLDRITRYDLTVTPNADGSLTMVCDVDWLVLDSDSEGPLEWVSIGLPNKEAGDFVALTDTIDEVSRDGSYARVDFTESYYAGETVHFAYQWTQRYMYTQNEDGSLSYAYTPGWFDSADVEQASITWNYGPDDSYAGLVTGASVSGDGAAEGSDLGSAYRAASTTALRHGERMTLTVQYSSWPAALAEGESAADYSGSSMDADEDEDLILCVTVVLFMLIVLVIVLVGGSRWDGGFGSYPTYVYVGGLYYPKGPDGRPRPGAPGVRTPPPSAYRGSGGGRTMGGGAGRGGGGCACASSCACACACACAGGGRAGCSAKNLYGAIHLPRAASQKPHAPQT